MFDPTERSVAVSSLKRDHVSVEDGGEDVHHQSEEQDARIDRGCCGTSGVETALPVVDSVRV